MRTAISERARRAGNLDSSGRRAADKQLRVEARPTSGHAFPSSSQATKAVLCGGHAHKAAAAARRDPDQSNGREDRGGGTNLEEEAETSFSSFVHAPHRFAISDKTMTTTDFVDDTPTSVSEGVRDPPPHFHTLEEEATPSPEDVVRLLNRRHCRKPKKQNQRKKPSAYVTHVYGDRVPPVLPALPLPLVPTRAARFDIHKEKNATPTDEPTVSMKRKVIKAVVRFASATLGKDIRATRRRQSPQSGGPVKVNLELKENGTNLPLPCDHQHQKHVVVVDAHPRAHGEFQQQQQQQTNSLSNCGLAIPDIDENGSIPEGLSVEQKPINPIAQSTVRKTFAVAAIKGALRKPVIHVEFDSPQGLKDCLACKSKDLLYVFVGLINVLVLQFVMVILMFFSDEEVDLNNLGDYYYHRYYKYS